VRSIERIIVAGLVSILFLLPVACGGAQTGSLAGGSQQEAERPETVRFAVTDIQGLESLQRSFGPFREELSETLGAEVEFFPVPDYTAATAAMEADRVDLVLTGPAEYVVMRAETEAVPVAGVSRPDYYSMIVARADSGIETPEDIRGEELYVGPPGSTSGHLGPCKILADSGISCQSDVELVHSTPPAIAEALASGQAKVANAAAAPYEEILLAHPRISEDDLRIVERGPQYPPDVFMANPNTLSEGFIREIRNRMLENEEALLRSIQEGTDMEIRGDPYFAEGSKMVAVEDSDYDYMREAYRAIGVEDLTEVPEE
jgi:phosphonate transport system substrate-binding protein